MQSEARVDDSIDVEVDLTIDVEIDRVPEQVGWQQVDAALRGLARRRAALDAAEARWLRAAAKVKIWRELGCVSLLDYLERRLGYAPRTAHDRVRVAFALAELPNIEAALEGGMPYSAVRELTRVATAKTERRWLDAARNKSVHEIEQLVSGHQRGSQPTDAPKPELATRTIPFEEVRPTTMALSREARAKLQKECGRQISDDELLARAFSALLEGGTSEPDRARYQVAVTICEQCGQGWQQGGGRQHAMDRCEVDRALCDAQHIGSLDEEPGRAVQDVSPRVRRFVFRRDGGKCSLPGCRSACNLELHHIVTRILGGTHDPSNVILLCDGCHSAHHRGLIAISGTADNLVVERLHPVTYEIAEPRVDTTAHVGTNPVRAEATAHVGTNPVRGELHADMKHREMKGSSDVQPLQRPSRLDVEKLRVDARAALVTAGFKRHEASTVVDRAISLLGPTASLETVVREALRSCAKAERHDAKPPDH